MSKYHPEYDKAENYLSAAEIETDIEKKLLLLKASATIKHLQKYRISTQKLLVEINNEVVDAIHDDAVWFDHENMEAYLPRIQASIETADDLKNEFSTPCDEWQHLSEGA